MRTDTNATFKQRTFRLKLSHICGGVKVVSSQAGTFSACPQKSIRNQKHSEGDLGRPKLVPTCAPPFADSVSQSGCREAVNQTEPVRTGRGWRDQGNRCCPFPFEVDNGRLMWKTMGACGRESPAALGFSLDFCKKCGSFWKPPDKRMVAEEGLEPPTRGL